MNIYWLSWLLLPTCTIYRTKSHSFNLSTSTTSTTLSNAKPSQSEHVQLTQLIIIAAVMFLSFCVVLLSLIYFSVKLKYQMRVDEIEDKSKKRKLSNRKFLESHHKYAHYALPSRSATAVSPTKSDKNTSSVSMNHEVSPRDDAKTDTDPLDLKDLPLDLKIIPDNKASDDIDINDEVKTEDENAFDSEQDEAENIAKQKQPNTRYKDSKEYKQINRVNVPYVIEIEEPPKAELDGYDVDLYTTPILAEYDQQKRKNSRRSPENAAKAKSPKAVQNENQHNVKSKENANSERYEWIRSNLLQVDAECHREYFDNFVQNQVTDERLDDLSQEDWKELIPFIGPRNAFRRLYEMKKKKKEVKEAVPVILELEDMKSISEIDMNLSESESNENLLERKGTSFRVTEDENRAVYAAVDEALTSDKLKRDTSNDEDDVMADILD